MPRFIDIHTHKNAHTVSGCIVNVDQRQFHAEMQLPSSYSSMGLHPWFLLDATFNEELNFLRHQVLSDRIVAIGECGLDRHCETGWTLQTQAFIAQIELANTLEKPLIIHCVRAFDEVMHLLKRHDNHVPVIFHGFNKKAAVAEKLIQAGYYLSFGASLLQDRNIEAFDCCPPQQLFLETDDSPVAIDEIYERAAALRGLPVTALAKQMEANLQHIHIAI